MAARFRILSGMRLKSNSIVRTGVRRWTRATRKRLTIENLDELSAGTKPEQELVWNWHLDKGSPKLNRFVQALANARGKNRKRWLRWFAGFVATTPYAPFEKIRSHFDFVDIDRKGNVWFSNQRIGELIEPSKASPQEINDRIMNAKIERKRPLPRLKRFLRTALIAWGLSEAMLPTAVDAVTKGLQWSDKRTLVHLTNYRGTLEQEQTAARQKMYEAFESPSLTEAEQERIAQQARDEMARLDREIQRTKLEGARVRTRMVQRGPNALQSIRFVRNRLLRPGTDFPYLPLVPIVIASMAEYLRRNRLYLTIPKSERKK